MTERYDWRPTLHQILHATISLAKMIAAGKRIVTLGNYFSFDFFFKELWLNENYKFPALDNISSAEKNILPFKRILEQSFIGSEFWYNHCAISTNIPSSRTGNLWKGDNSSDSCPEQHVSSKSGSSLTTVGEVVLKESRRFSATFKSVGLEAEFSDCSRSCRYLM